MQVNLVLPVTKLFLVMVRLQEFWTGGGSFCSLTYEPDERTVGKKRARLNLVLGCLTTVEKR